MNRRQFLGAAATIATPVEGSGTQPAPAGQWEIENGDQRLVFLQDDRGLAYQAFLRDKHGAWANSSLPGNRLIAGPSFPLHVLSGHLDADGSLLRLQGKGHAEDESGKLVGYDWECAVDGRANAPWFRFRTVLHLPKSIRLRQQQEVEPQIVLWLDDVTNLEEGQSLTWGRTLLEGPTRNSMGAWGNDFPGVYLHDWGRRRQCESMLFFDLTAMNWMSAENIPRFLLYRCTRKMEVHGERQRQGIGLVAAQAAGERLPAGDVVFAFWLLQRRHSQPTTTQQATVRFISAALPLFEENLAWPPGSTTWKEFAAGTVENLQKPGEAWIEVNGHRGLRSYARASSKFWGEDRAAQSFELITLVDVLWPSLLYRQLHPLRDPGHWQRLESSLPLFFRPDLSLAVNDYGSRGSAGSLEGPHDVWYFFENALVRYAWIAALKNDGDLKTIFLKSLATATAMMRDWEYQVPLFFGRQDEKIRPIGASTNYPAGALYAAANLQAHQMTGEAAYLAEARHALKALGRAPDERMFHECHHLGWAALAAARLGSVTGEPEWKELAVYFLRQHQRMFYWYSDPSQRHDIRGGVQACSSLLYPAPFENIASILTWTGLLALDYVEEPMLRFLDQQRRNNFYFFEECLRPGVVPSSGRYIPYENLGMLELGGQTGTIGKEIYGSGEVLWMYLMFEALAVPSERELLLVNLDLLEHRTAVEFPPPVTHFILYNPTAAARRTRITVPWTSQPVSMALTAEGGAGPFEIHAAAGQVELGPHQYRKVRITVER